MSDAQFQTAMAELKACWQNSPEPTVKVTSYFPVYTELFVHLRGKPCTFIETGVLDGGSLFMWRQWLGSEARIIGIDLNPAAKRWEAHGFEIYIGDQGDPVFWQRTLDLIGGCDALLDDGGHQSFQQIVTTVEAIKRCGRRAVVAIEDTATSFLTDFARHGQQTFLEYAKDATDLLTARSRPIYRDRFPKRGNAAAVAQFAAVYSIQFFNGIVAFKVDPDLAIAPEIVRNRDPNSASDFRYEGTESAVVEWPDAFASRVTTVLGGRQPEVSGPGRVGLMMQRARRWLDQR